MREVVRRCSKDNVGARAVPATVVAELRNRIEEMENDIYEIKAQYGDKITLVGNIDVASVLSFGTPTEVRESTREHIERLGADGGYVVCSSHSIIDSVPPENYTAMIEATKEFGTY